MRIVPPTANGIAEGARAIREGLLVVYPTETVYGIGADPYSVEAIHRVYESKERAEHTPLLLVASDLDQVRGAVEELSLMAARFAEAFWPGPLSLLLPKSAGIPDELTGGSPKVCIRIPSHDTARALCREVGHAIISTSANRTGESAARSLAEVSVPGVALGIDSGELPPSPPSTVYDPETNTILRHGAVAAAELERIAAS